MKKILFLDIDGVLNNEEWFRGCVQRGVYDPLNPELVQKLNKLDCEVVISSSWGCDNGQTWKKLRRKGFNLKVIGYTEHYEMGSDWIVRGNSIKKWLHDNMGLADYQYAILDDDGDMLLEQKDHFVQTDGLIGLTDQNVENVKGILESDIV
jgi:hypothetical protein